ncbi:glycosyltransferase [Ectopseudomonas mendocina]
MNVFVLCVGRCGSVTFTQACSHIENYTASHESRCQELGEQRLAYPENHIEVDNRLAWFLGRLHEQYGDSAVYVYLRRSQVEIADSYNKRWANDLGIMPAFAKGILKSRRVGLDVAVDLVRTVSENIECFLRDKSQVFVIDIENPVQGFSQLWRHIGAQGDLELALGEFKVKHNTNIFVTDVADSLEGEALIIRQLEDGRDRWRNEAEKLRVVRERLQSSLDRARTEQQLATEQIRSLQTQLHDLRSSASYRLGHAITRNVKTPKGWLKLPRDIWRVIASKGAASERGASKHAIWVASQVAKKKGWPSAIAFAEKYAKGVGRNPIHLMRANLAENDSLWLEGLNTYLAENNAGSRVALQPGEKARFYRLVANNEQRDDSSVLISVIMPAFNAEKTLRLAAGSILNQTHSNLELIIVDDCSSDSTYSIACELAKSDSRVKVLRNPVNVGPYVSKNLALRLAGGQYITGHDADDWALPNRLSRDLALIERSGGRIKAIVSSMLRMIESGAILHFSKVGLVSTDGANRVASISLFIESAVLREVLGGWDSVRFGADSELIARARLYLKDEFIQTDQVGMLCLDHESSLTNHATLGIDRTSSGISPVRLAYREAWQEWHQYLHMGSYKLAFPLIERPYDAPRVMQVPPDAVEACIAESSYAFTQQALVNAIR